MLDKRASAGSTILPSPKSILPRSKNWGLLDLDTLEVARQLSLIESSIFQKIRPVELLKQEWLVKKRPSKAVHIKAMTALSTKVCIL